MTEHLRSTPNREDIRGVLEKLHECYPPGGWSGADQDVMRGAGRAYIFNRGDRVAPGGRCPPGLFVLLRGQVHRYALSVDGKKVVLELHSRFGDKLVLGVMGNELLDEAVSEALADETVLYGVSWLQIQDIALKQPSLAIAVAKLEQTKRLEREVAIAEQTFYCIKARLAHKLPCLAAPDGNVIKTREELAALTGSTQNRVIESLWHANPGKKGRGRVMTSRL